MVKKEVTPGSRKSARISAMEEKARMLAIQKQAKDEAICGGDATSITSSSSATAKMGACKCKSLQEFVTNCVTTSPHQEGETKSEDNASKAEQMENAPSLQGMPNKLTLEVVLDMLQRETHEIFAHPVDPQEVVGYGNIIREPMDFGTMRAKLQEGMYKSLEQFEHDVFLISSNAMKFNSSTTVYYKEARALSKLAQSVFHFLRTNPENFQLGFSRTRRHPGRKPQSEAGGSHSRSAKLANPKDGFSLDYPSIQRTAVSLPQFKPYIGQTNVGYVPGSRDDMILNSSETDRHMTYKSLNSFCWENEKLVSTVYNAPKPPPHVSNAGSKHSESLLNFIRNLGAEAQSAANKKLEKCPDEPPKILSWTPKGPKRPFGETADIRLPSPALRKSAAYLNQVNDGQMPYNIISSPPGSYKGKMVCANGGINISGRQLKPQNSLSGPRPQTTDGGLTHYNVVGGQGPNKSGITNAYGSSRSSDNMDLLATLTQISGIQTQVNHNPSGTNKVTTGSSSSIAAPAFALNQNKLMERKQPAESWYLPAISYLPALQTEAAKQIPPARNVVLQEQVASTEVKTMNFVGGAKPEGDQAEASAQGLWNALRSSATDNKKQPDLNLQL